MAEKFLKLPLMGFLLLSFFLGSPSFAAQVDQSFVKVFNILPFVNADLQPDRLEEVAFSIQNLSDRPIYSLKFELIVRNPTREIIHAATSEINWKRYMGKPLAPSEIRQMSESLRIRGYRIYKSVGSVVLRVIDVSFSE